MLGAAVAGAGIATGLVASAEPAEASNGNPVELGETNTETSTTVVTNANSGALEGSTSANGGHSGVRGTDTSTKGGFGVAGSSTNGAGVSGSSTNGAGVSGTTSGNNQAGVSGIDGSPDGAFGVHGFSRVGVAVFGKGTSGAYGVQGESTISIGVYGSSPTGTGVYASSPDGYALQVAGTAQFTGTVLFSRSGEATVAAGKSSVVVSGVALSTSSIVLATLQGYLAGLGVAGVAKDASASKMTIHLTKATTAALNVAWFVIG
jgi:hypothetical protein